jgi:predicted DNA binding CopG/RHH family protein/uncharacterized DUF497 family protein
MDFEGFVLDRGNRSKCQQHGMRLDEIESVFPGPVVILPDKENPAGERRFRAIGMTSQGRNAFVVFHYGPGTTASSSARLAPASCTRSRLLIMKKTIPTFNTDKEAEDFVAEADLSEYDLSGGQVVRFELKPKDTSVNLRLPQQLLQAVRGRAAQAGIPYQRFIRMALERALHDPK